MTPTRTCREPGCDASGEGGWAEVDRAAEKHTKTTSHSTATRTTGAIREREGGRVVDRKTRSANA